ncbi:MAG: homoserine dehydrogenase [Lachnospiraceae bacterium]|nr:homoserine dehydrogenase [Lachnospiraceae bacterium]
MINVAVLGYGTVGSGVVEVIETNKKDIERKIGADIEVKYILDLRDFPGDPYEAKVVHDYKTIVNDPDMNVICETMGGLEPAFTFTKEALSKGISVCTSNKELVAAHGPELIRLAQSNKCNYMFEASVGGGIPIIRPMNSALTAEHIDFVMGILNGTTNYILTRMDEDGADFADALKEAQDLGYAEKDPTADVEGFDISRKIAILSSLVCGHYVNYEDIYTEGITKISAEDLKYAHAMNKAVKFLALSRETHEGFFAMVAPFMVDREHPLYMVRDAFNAVFIHGNTLDNTMYYGRGAGKLPTASAVVADVVDCARHLGKCITILWDDERVELTDANKYRCPYFVRVPADKADAAKSAFKIDKVIDAGIASEFAFVTGEIDNTEYEASAAKVGDVINRIRLI